MTYIITHEKTYNRKNNTYNKSLLFTTIQDTSCIQNSYNKVQRFSRWDSLGVLGHLNITMNIRLILTFLKYGAIIGFVIFLGYSVVSSYTLRETVGQLEQQLKTEQEQREDIFNQLEQQNKRLKQLQHDRTIIFEEIQELRRVTNEEFFNNYFNMLYPDSLSDDNNS